MSNFALSFEVVFPLFVMMALGYILRRIHIFNENFLGELNNLVFKVFLPLLLFINVYKSDFKSAFNAKLILFSIIAICIVFFALLLIVPMFVKNNANRGVIIQGIFRSNFILFGFPMAVSLFGAENTSITAVLIAFVVPLFNALSVVALSIFSEVKVSAKQILIQMIKNPLIIASAIAFMFVFTGFKFTPIIENTLTDITKIATPLALIILGGSFTFSGLKKHPSLLTFSVLGKLVIVPMLCVGVAVFLGFRGIELASLFAMFASPTAVSSYTMARSMKANYELAGQIVVVDSVASIFSIFIGISLLASMGML